MQNLISCRSALFGNVDTAFQLFPEAGVHFAEVPPPADGDYAALKEKADRAGITASTLATGVTLDTDETAQDFVPVIDGAATIGVKHIFVSFKAAAEIPRNDVIARIRGLAQHAAEKGCVICMETHPPFGTNGDVARQTIAEVNEPALRYNFDTANIYYYNRGTDTIAELKKISDLIASVHLKDTFGEYESGNFPALGTGVVDFPQVFSILEERQFSGPYTLEVEGQAVSGFDDKQRLDFLCSCMNYLRQIGVSS